LEKRVFVLSVLVAHVTLAVVFAMLAVAHVVLEALLAFVAWPTFSS
jgi:hypothetical protein